MKYCTKCGSELKDTDLFCSNCGEKVNRIVEKEDNLFDYGKAQESSTKPRLRNIKGLLGFIFSIEAILDVLVYYYFRVDQKNNSLPGVNYDPTALNIALFFAAAMTLFAFLISMFGLSSALKNKIRKGFAIAGIIISIISAIAIVYLLQAEI